MEEVILVDESDREIGEMEKFEAHQRGRLHRAFAVFLRNDQGQLLLQKRADTKYHTGGLWANACDGHPRAGETVIQAAQRRLRGELGIECALSVTDHFVYQVSLDHDLQEHEFLYVLTGVWNGSVRPDPREVSEVRWLKPDLLQREVVKNEAKCCYWTRLALERLLSLPS